ncbi:PCSK5 convertase, partial [Amia calva]|nr:PCSK5 convertase [Amia calva]
MPNCEICTDADVCAKCQESYKLQNGICQAAECEEGQVQDPETGECFDCEAGCKTCSTDDPELCNSCMEGYFLYRHQCRRRCPQKTYEDVGRKICFSCPVPCTDCFSESLCLACQPGHFLTEGGCVKQCPDGTYGDTNGWRCEACHSSCQSCHGLLVKDCDVCPDGNLPLYGQCPAASCLEGQYFDATDAKCYACDISCKTCFGPQALDCSSCFTGYLLDQEGSCVEHCPAGYFVKSESQLCEECSPNCETCEETSDTCVSCKKGKYRLFLHEGKCWSNCPEGYFERVEGTCEACDDSCLTCDENKYKCLSCVKGLYLENHQCNGNCSFGSYPAEDGTCSRCSAHCDVCTDANTCMKCSFLYLLLNGVCKANCPDGYYEDLDKGKCVPCHPTCATCSGPETDDCESCSLQYPRLYDGRCSEDCPPGTYYEISASECQECDLTCASCLGPEATQCIKCKEGLALDQETRMCGVTGDSNCPPKMFLHEDRFTCNACHRQCESCVGPADTDCQTCTVPSYLYNGTCVTGCPGGTFQSSEEADRVELGFCSVCDHVCDTCTGASPKDCITCSSGYLKFLHLCISHCPTGYYREKTRCEKCDSSCGRCSGPGIKSCLACPPHLLELESTKLCVEHCPQRFYQQDHKCRQCHTSCKTCKDATPQGCLTCDRGSTLQDGICYPRCEERHYFSEDELCKLCDPSCRHCSGPGPHQCLTCKPNFSLHPLENRCDRCCESKLNNTNCCHCSTNSALCVEVSFPMSEHTLLSGKADSQMPSHASIALPALLVLALVLGLAMFALFQARARKRLCWKQSYERLSGSAKAAPPTSTMLHGVPGPEDSGDETDVVYTSRDGTVYRRYNFIKAEDGKDDNENTYLSKS